MVRTARGVIAVLFLGVLIQRLSAPDGSVADLTYLGVTCGAAAVAWVAARACPRGDRPVPQLIATALTLSALGDAVFLIYQSNGIEPDVSLADGPWLASYVALGAAVVVAIVRGAGGRRVDTDVVLDVLTAATVSVGLLWGLLVEPVFSDTGTPIAVRVVWAAYPIADALMVALVLRAVFSRGSRAVVGVAAVGGVLCWLAADVGFMVPDPSGNLSGWLDIGWLVGALLLAVGVERRATRPWSSRPESIATEHRFRLGSIALAYVPMFALGVIELYGFVTDTESSPLPLLASTAVLMVISAMRTVRILGSEQKARAALRSGRRYYELLSAHSSDAVLVLDPQGTVTNESKQLAQLLGIESTAGTSAMGLVSPADRVQTQALFDRALDHPGGTFGAEVRVAAGDGKEGWFGIRVVNLLDDPDVAGVVVNVHDITERKRAEHELSHQAFHDALTGLANRALFRDRLDQSLLRRTRAGLDPAVIFLDLDGFKTVNDGLGHEAGDQLLREVAERLSASVRPDDTVARLGGDEFAILIEQSRHPINEASMIAERALKALAVPFEVAGHRISISASIGVASGDAGSTASILVRNADVAMYRAKSEGKGCFVVYDPHMRTAAVERLQLGTDLVSVLDTDQLHLMYQPVVELESDRIVGFEAVLRWDHPSLGPIMPDTFIPIAEETGLDVPIGAWALRTACETAARWQQVYGRNRRITMAINLSARQLASEDLVAQIADVLAESGMDPATLVLEMTEPVLQHDPTLAARRLRELRALGVRLAIDDFGAGYSSPSYLRQFPVDILKVDRSFMNSITDRTKIPAIVRGMFGRGRTLELETVAEGVGPADAERLLSEIAASNGGKLATARP